MYMYVSILTLHVYIHCGDACICSECMDRLDTNKSTYDVDQGFNVFDSVRNESILTSQSYDIVQIKSHLTDYPSYITIYEGMGCCTIIRRLNPDSPIEGLFNHSDDGYSPEKVAKLENFIQGYCYIEYSPMMSHDWTGE